jgi:DNA gyrase subunit A
MVVADPDATLLTMCEKGYGKRTPIGPNSPAGAEIEEAAEREGEGPGEPTADLEKPSSDLEVTAEGAEEGTDEGGDSTSSRYPTKGRGTMGVRDIKTTDRNGRVVAIEIVRDSDELLLMTARGKLQRLRASDISVIGRNTQGVRIMSLDEGDSVVAVVRVPPEEVSTEEAIEAPPALLPEPPPGTT